MKWSAPRVIFYKLSRMGAILFYLIFGTIYVLDDISYSKDTDSDLDDKVQNLVILFVFSGFALQL
jgi:phosphate starvation-inducible membrane PsiE